MSKERVSLVNGIKLITKDDVIAKKYSNKSFESETFDIWENYSKKEGTVIDIGAYTGIYSLVAAKMGASVISFEPNKRIYNRLKKI